MFERLEWLDVLLLSDYNTRLVVLSSLLLGAACGLIGSYLLLRKRSLMGDTLSHATLPGVALAFLLSVSMGGEGKSLPVLLCGATLTGLLGCAAVQFIRQQTRIKDDAAMGIVLSVFFGAGVVLLGCIQSMPQASAAGLESFIYGKTASMVRSDFFLLAGVSLIVLLVPLFLFKELSLSCFDQAYAAVQGWPVRCLDALLFALVTLVVVAGLQAVGLILIIAFLITPAATAHLWTERLDHMLFLSALFGGMSGWFGAALSASFPHLPAGAMIVLTAAAGFLISLLFAGKRGVLMRYLRDRLKFRRLGVQDLLRTLYEIFEIEKHEATDASCHAVSLERLMVNRSWSEGVLRSHIRRAHKSGLIRYLSNNKDRIMLTEKGHYSALKIIRNHRLWEFYLLEYGDVASFCIDRNADSLERLIDAEVLASLESRLDSFHVATGSGSPKSPHPTGPKGSQS